MLMKTKTLFLSGRVSGLPYWWVYIKFLFWDFILSMLAFHVWNPTRQIHKDTMWDDALRICLENLHDQDYIFLIPGFRKSGGAMVERYEAIKQNKRFVSFWFNKKERIKFEMDKWERIKATEPEFDKDFRKKFINAIRQENETSNLL
jgi:hypothetical protein